MASDDLLLNIIQQGANNTAKSIDGVADSLDTVSEHQDAANKAGEESIAVNEKQSKSFLEVNAALDLFGKGINIAKDFAKQAVGDTLDYAKSVRELSLNIGTSVEETSKIIQAADDYGISTEGVTSALEMMTKRGVAPSIDKLAALADQFVSIDDPVKRAALMTETLGRGWTTLTPLLAAGGDALRDSAKEAENLGLVLSTADVKAARELEIGMDNLGDKVEAVKLKIGLGIIPIINKLIDQTDLLTTYLAGSGTEADRDADRIQYLTNMYGENSDFVKAAISIQKKHTDALSESARVREDVVNGLRQQGDAQVWATANVKIGGIALRDYNQTVIDVKDQLGVLEAKRQELFDMGFQRGSAQLLVVKADMDALKVSIGDTSPQIEYLEQKVKDLTEMGFSPASKQIQLVNDKIGELKVKGEIMVGAFSNITPQMEDSFLAAQASIGPLEESVDKMALSMKDLTAQTIYNVAAQGLDADSALKLAVKMGFVDQSAEDAARAITGMKNDLLAGKIGPEQYADSVSRMDKAIKALQDKNVTITMTALLQEVARIRGYESGVEGGLMGGGRAYGGAVSAGVPYIIGERGAESFVYDRDYA